MENSVNVFVDYAGEPLDLACSVCGFSIHRAPDYYGNEYGPLEYSAHSEKQYAMKIPIGEELTLKSVRINGAPAKLKINQVIDPYRTKAIVVPEEISPTILKLNIYSPVPIKVNAPGTQIINPQAAQAHAISGINTTVSPIPMEQAPHGTGVDFEVVDEASNFSTDPSSWEQVNSVNLGEIPVGTEIQVLSNYPIRTYEYTLKKVAPDEIIMWIGTDSTQGFKFSPTRFSSLGRESFIDMTIYPQTLVTDTSAAFPYYEFEGGALQSLDDIDSATFFGPVSEIRINTGKGKPISDTTNYFDDELDVIECVDVDLGACTFKANSATLTDDPTLALKGKLAQTINGKIVADMDKIESISISIKKPRFVISNLGRRMGDPLGGATLKIYDGTTEVAAITAYLNPKNPKKLIIILANQNDRSGYTFNKIFGRRFSEELLARVLALDQFKDITRIDWTSLTESAQNLLRNAAGSTTIAADGKIINLPQKTNLNALQKDPVKLNQFRVQKGLPELNGTELENLFSENVPKTQSIVKKLIKFFCASPCVFENGTPVEIIEEFSDIDIYGDFSKIGKSDIITYSYKLVEQGGIANALGGAPNLSTTHVGILESAMITGKTVATIQPLNTGKQAIIIYRPQELALLPIDSTGATRAVVQADVLEINEALARLNFENSNDLMKTKDVAVKSYLDFVEEINPTKAEEIMILREASDYSKAERSNAVKSLMFESEAELFYSPITGETVTIEEYLAHYYTDLGLGDFGFDFSQRRLSLDEVKKLNSAVVHRNNKFLVKKEKVFVAKATKLFDDYATGVFTGDTQKANFAKNQLASIQSELFALNNEGYLDDISPLFINRYKILIDELATQTSIFLSVTAPNGNSSKTLLTFTDITHESLIDGEFLPLGDLGFMDSTVSVVFRDNFALSDGTKTSANLLNANKVLIHEVDHIVQHLVGTKPSIMEGLAVNAEDRLVLSQDGFFVEDGYGSMYYFEHTLYKSGRIWENNEYGQGYYAIKTLEKGGTDISSVYGPTFETPNLAEVEAELAIWANNLSPEIIPQLTSFVQPIKPTSNLAFECHSPCNWTSTQSPIKIFSPSQTVNIDGDYEAKFVKEIRPIETYNPSTVNINKINSNGLTQAQVNQVFSAMQKGQAVAVISSHYSGGQEITIYTPKGTATTFTATTTSAPIQTIPAATTPINLIKEKILQSGGTITSDVEVALSKNYKLVTSNDKKIVLLSPEVEYAENIISRNWMQTYKTEYQIHLLGFYDSQSGVLFVEKPIFSEKNLLLDYSKLSNSDIVNIYSPRSQLLHLYFYEYYKYTLLAPNTAEANIAATKIKELILEFYQKGLISEYTTSPIVSKLISNDDSWVDEILNVDSILTTVSAGSTPTFRNKVNNLKIQSQIKPSVDLYPVASNHPHPQIDNRSLEDNIKASTGDICVLMGQRNSIENSYEIQTIENESFFQSLLKAIFGDPNLDKQKLSLVPSYISITGENGGVNRAIITGQTCTYYADSLGVAPGTTQTHNSFPVEEFERIQAFEYSN